jgi:hypothetical protein
VSLAPEPAAGFLSLLKLNLASQPATESMLSPAPESVKLHLGSQPEAEQWLPPTPEPATQIPSWREEPNPAAPCEVLLF